VEFAIVLSVLILLVFGIVQFGLAWHRVQGLQAAVREGARLASIGATYNEIQARVREAQSAFDPNHVAVSTQPGSTGTQRPCASAGLGNPVAVTASVNSATYQQYAVDIPLWGKYTPTYTATGVFRCERTGP
jgi:Flp pilus assembly protein TadG